MVLQPQPPRPLTQPPEWDEGVNWEAVEQGVQRFDERLLPPRLLPLAAFGTAAAATDRLGLNSLRPSYAKRNGTPPTAAAVLVPS